MVSDSGNYLTLDKAAYSFDGVKYSEKLDCLKVFDIMLNERYKGDLYLKYTFDVESVPKEICFLAEDMHNEWCEINGNRVTFDGVSDFDKGIYKADISSFVVKGENQAVIKINYYQSEDVYFALFNEKATEGIKNKMVYSTNIESCYLQGDFGVFAKNGLKKGKNEGVWYGSDFYISEKKKSVTDLAADGYPFFAGNITLKKKFTHGGGDCVLSLKGKFGYAEVFVNGKRAVKSYFDNKVDVSELVVKGENELEITLYTGNRNLLGPHRFVEEECWWVGPGTFELFKGQESDGEYLFGERTLY